MDVVSIQRDEQAARLAALVKDSGYYKAVIAQRAGINPTVLSYLLSGKRALNRSYATRLALVLDVDPAYLMDGDE